MDKLYKTIIEKFIDKNINNTNLISENNEKSYQLLFDNIDRYLMEILKDNNYEHIIFICKNAEFYFNIKMNNREILCNYLIENRYDVILIILWNLIIDDMQPVKDIFVILNILNYIKINNKKNLFKIISLKKLLDL